MAAGGVWVWMEGCLVDGCLPLTGFSAGEAGEAGAGDSGDSEM